MQLTRLKFSLLVAGVLALAASAAFAISASQLTLHEKDSGRQYKVHVGDIVKVDLLDRYGFPGSATSWTADSSDASVLSRVGATRESPLRIVGPLTIRGNQAHYIAIFKAQKAGAATIEMVGAATCEAMRDAFCPQHAGSISIVVS